MAVVPQEQSNANMVQLTEKFGSMLSAIAAHSPAAPDLRADVVDFFEINFGAQEKTRTSTILRSLAPEASASTNSATWAGG